MGEIKFVVEYRPIAAHVSIRDYWLRSSTEECDTYERALEMVEGLTHFQDIRDIRVKVINTDIVSVRTPDEWRLRIAERHHSKDK